MDLFINEIKLKTDILDADRQQYPFNLSVVRNLDCLYLQSQVTFLVGENGTGKSTLMEAIAVNYGFNPEGGSKNFNFSTNNTHSDLYRFLILSKGVKRPKDGFFMRAESFYNLASQIDRDPELINSYGGKSLHAMSHGESFLKLISNRFWGEGLYVLDEPEAALSPQGQFALLVFIAELADSGSQFIISTHSPILMAYPGAQIYVLTESGITLTPYQETEHYILTKQFLNQPEGMLKQLLR